MVLLENEQEMVDAAAARFIRADGCRPGAGEDCYRALHLHFILIAG